MMVKKVKGKNIDGEFYNLCIDGHWCNLTGVIFYHDDGTSSYEVVYDNAATEDFKIEKLKKLNSTNFFEVVDFNKYIARLRRTKRLS